MKRIICLVLSIIFVLSIITFVASCNKEDVTTNITTTEKIVDIETTKEDTKIDETTASEQATTTETTADEKIEDITKSEFDENKIVFTFAALSDTHIESTGGTVANKFKSALNQLKARAEKDCENGLGAVMIAGDLINSGYSSQSNYVQMSYFKSLYESVLNPNDVPMVYVLGNHDTLGEWTDNTVNEQKILNTYLTKEYFSTDVDMDALNNYGCRHCVIDGYHVLTIVPKSKGPVLYTQEAKTWLDNKLKEITEENPEQYVFVLTHPMIYDTVYGSTLGNNWYTEDLTSILSKYSQVVTFSGHLHFPLNDPRSIMQTSFTSLGCGSVKYMAIEDGGYIDMAGATTMKDKDQFSQGLLVEIDENGNIRFVRMDFYHNDVIGECWEISHPNKDNTHLNKYTKERGNDENNTSPVLSSMDYTCSKSSTGIKVNVTFDAAEDDEFAHDYVLNIYKDNKLRRTFKILADFYLHTQTKDMKKQYTVDCGTLSSGEYEVELIAYDSWGKTSDPVKMNVTIDKNQVPNTETGTNAPLSVYVDFDFVDGKVIDTKDNVNISIRGATVKESTVKLSGKEYKVEALNTSKDKYVICTFKHLSSEDQVKQFAEKGFSVEAFYYAEKSGAVQGIVCGTQAGGFGLAVTADYKPYFITGYGTQGKYNPSVTSPVVSSNTDIVHVVAVYDVETLTSSIYVNGEIKAVETISDTFAVGHGLTYNIFCLGADVTSDLLGGDFQTKNMTMLDAKIYTGVLDDSDVVTAYQNALAMLK